jgi:hypothetical protein
MGCVSFQLEANPCEGFGNDFNPNVPFPAGIPAWSRVTCNLRKDGLTHLKRTQFNVSWWREERNWQGTANSDWPLKH